MLKKVFSFLVVALLFFACPSAHAGLPADSLKVSVEKVIGVLNDPGLKGESKKMEKRNRIFLIIEESFDFAEMAKRSIGDSWPKLTEQEQKELEVAFSNLLEKSYIGKIETFTDERVEFEAEKPKGDRYYSVSTHIVSAGKTIPVEYSLHNVGGHWMVYDVSVEGVSLVSNYRAQFGETMRREGFKGLMVRLNERLKGLE